jgi:tetratricopeptide (TPR) repeat protein
MACENGMADVAANPECADLLNRAAGYFYGSAAYSEARPLFERILAMREKRFGSEHPDTTASLNNLALLVQAQGDLAGARRLVEGSVALDEKALGLDHRETATRLGQPRLPAYGPERPCGGAAALRAGAGYPREGARPRTPRHGAEPQQHRRSALPPARSFWTRPLYERALAIREKALGPEHPDTAESLNNLAELLQNQRDFAGARPFHERALAIREKALGPEHPDTAGSLNNLRPPTLRTGQP